MKKLITAFLLSILLIGLSYFLHKGFRVSEKVRVPGLMRLMNPNDGLWKNVDISFLNPKDEITLQGPNNPITVYYDDRLVPHIFASNIEDATFAQGYILAQHRLWQMDFMVRLSAGRLSEVLGKATINRDLMMRKFGLEYGAKKAIKEWKKFPEDYKSISYFKDGINAYINGLQPEDLPLEFKLANYKPAEWTDLSSALISKNLAFTLSRRGPDVSNTNTLLHIGEEEYNKLFHMNDPNQIPVIRENVAIESSLRRDKPDDVHDLSHTLSGYTYHAPHPGAGSNNWAVAPSKTSNGSALLANDPHLQLTLPSIWYEMHIVCPGINSYGVTVPGIPGIIIGFNDHIAYGSTNVGHDVLDYYTIDWVDKEKGTYKVDGKVLEAQKVPQKIKVRGQEDIQWDMMITEFGPIVWESENPDNKDLAMQWLANKSPNKPEFNSFIKALQCKDYDCYKAATSNFLSPAQNFVYADREGNIGLRINGHLPVKYEGEGAFVKKGTSLQNKWSEFLPRESNPQTLNPSLGFVSSANQKTTDESFAHPYIGGFEDYRGRRINELLEEGEQLDYKDMMAFQLDELNIKAREFTPLILSNIPSTMIDDKNRKIVDALKTWDFRYSKDSEAPYYFEKIADKIEDAMWDELESEDYKMSKPDFWRLYQLALENPEDAYFDIKSTPEKESFQSLVSQAFAEASEEIDLSKEHNWGEKLPTNVMHLINIPAYSRTDLPTGGNGDVLNALKGNFGPSWRMVVELGTTTKAWGVYPGGQSGNPLSPFYDNMVDDWATGNYNELFFSADESTYKEKCKIVHTLIPTNE